MSEAEFDLVATAAYSAQKRGSWKDAADLDKLARKINAALSNARVPHARRMGLEVTPLTWQDVPSTLPSSPPTEVP